MRDALLTALIAVLLVMVFRHPPVGAYLWAWLSLMNPHKLTYGFAYSFGFAQLAAIATGLSLLFTRKRYKFPWTPLSIVWLLFIFWMSVTAVFSINDATLVWDRWLFVIKIQVMIIISILLIRTRRDLDILIWVVTMSIGLFGVKGGVWTVLTGGGGRVWGPPESMVESNNSLAVALTMLVPFMYYLYQISTRRLIRYGLIFSIGACFFAILGSQSRGALLAVVAMAFVLALKSRRPLRSSLVLFGILAVAVAFMPESWTSRMDTIGEYQEDSSAMSRIYTWLTLWNLAVDRPLFGGGFRSDSLALFLRYAPSGPDFEAFRGQSWVAHSIYLQALGEHGFVGFFLFLLMGLLVWRRAAQLTKLTRGDPEFGTWVPHLMPMIQVSLLGYAVGGAFLSLVHFDLPYYLVAYLLIVDAMVRARKAVRPAAQVPDQRAAAPGSGPLAPTGTAGPR